MLSVILILIYFFIFLAIIATLYIERKKPLSAFVWVIILTMLPVVGFIFYLIFGRNVRINKRHDLKLKEESDKLYNNWLHDEKLLLSNDREFLNDSNMYKYKDLIEMNINSGKSIYSQDNDIAIFTNGRDKFNALLKDIENAKETIHLLYFIIRNDFIGREVVNALTTKAKEGIEVRVLYDQVGSFSTPNWMFKDLVNAGGEVYSFFPFKLGTYLRINYRNHRKIVIIDGKIGYTGGMNIGDEYMGLNKHLTPWRDTHLRITGSSVYLLQERFLMDWSYASSKKVDFDEAHIKKFFSKVETKGNIGVQIVSSGPDVIGEQIKRAYIKMINSAKKDLYIQTPYFVPDDSFLEAIQIAALSGVNVKLMLPSTPDKRLVYRASTSYIKDILNCGGKVYLYPGFLHSKMLVIDGEVASIGTANMDIRSFALDFEINAFIYSTGFSSKCANIFKEDLDISEEITAEKYNSRSFFVKFEEGIMRLFSPLF